MAEMTIYTLAKKLNMTPSMVSRALSPTGRISEEKRQIVLAAAKKYNFHPNKFASRLSMKPIHIGVLICSRFQINTDKMIEGIRRAHAKLMDYKIKYDVSVLSPEGASAEVSAALLRYRGADGIIVSGMSAPCYTELLTELSLSNPNVVQVQSVNERAPTLFSSKHNEAVASGLAVDFLSLCLARAPRKNVLLFTGALSSTVHANAAAAFGRAAEARGLTHLATVDMKDDEAYFESILPAVFAEYGSAVDGIYVTSGLSLPLCRYLEKNGIELPLVAFDTHAEIKRYMEAGVISAAISQDVVHQMQLAFENLAFHIISGKECPPVIHTDLHLMLKSNMHQFD